MSASKPVFSRRNLLALGGMTAVAGAAGSLAFSADADVRAQSHPGHPAPIPVVEAVSSPRVAPFSVPMPIPRVLRPVSTSGDTDVYRLDIVRANVEILPGLRTQVFSYGGGFIGPTIMARTGRKTRITYCNSLDRPANVHLHGGHVPAASDGYPLDTIQPGGRRPYDYPNSQQGATLWYHDHSHHTEAEGVYRGLGGFYLLDDAAERNLRLPSGDYDVPIMLRDAHFDEQGTMLFGDPGLRDTILVNGRSQPYFRVARRKYRFRLLNAANERRFELNLDGTPMTKIASDGGLLPSPVPLTEIGVSGGERVEFVVDFARHPIGTNLVLSDGIRPILRFDIVADRADDSRLPDRLRALPTLPPATVTRNVTLSFDMSGDPVALVNGQSFDPARVDFRIRRGTTEIWNVTNGDGAFGFHHNFHLHLQQFRVLDRDGAPPWEADRGLKDTIYVPPGTTARIQAQFTEHLGKFVYHCHFLEHSSIGMMAQMEIVP